MLFSFCFTFNLLIIKKKKKKCAEDSVLGHHTLAFSGKLWVKSTSPTAKSSSPELWDTNFFVPWSPKNLGDIPDFVEDFYSHIVLFKQLHFVRVVSPLAPFFDQQEPNMPMRLSL